MVAMVQTTHDFFHFGCKGTAFTSNLPNNLPKKSKKLIFDTI